MDPTEIKLALEHCEFFERLEKSDISEIAGLCRVNTYEGGEYVFQQGDYGEYIYIDKQSQIMASLVAGTKPNMHSGIAMKKEKPLSSKL